MEHNGSYKPSRPSERALSHAAGAGGRPKGELGASGQETGAGARGRPRAPRHFGTPPGHFAIPPRHPFWDLEQSYGNPMEHNGNSMETLWNPMESNSPWPPGRPAGVKGFLFKILLKNFGNL